MKSASSVSFAVVLAALLLSPQAVSQRRKPYRAMDYGPTLAMTVEVAPGNIAQKGLCLRLDPGPGGVSRGDAFMVFETDTLRYAAGWSGEGFIDWRGIIFNGAHNAHPKIVGRRTFANPSAPGWADPETGTFDDPRLRGVDERAYGPLPRSWGRWKGHYVRGDETILSYDVGTTAILEVPGLLRSGDDHVFIRTLEVAGHDEALTLQVAHETRGAASLLDLRSLLAADGTVASDDIAILGVKSPAPTSGQLDFGTSDYTVCAWIKTSAAQGSILSKAPPEGPWAPKGKCFFVRGGRLGFDVGWVGQVASRKRVDDGEWHHVAVTYRASDGRTELFIDGRPDGSGSLKSEDGAGHIVRLGYTATTFMPPFKGALDDVRVFRRRLARNQLRAVGRGDEVPNVQAWWPCDEGEGGAVVNAAGGGFRGELSRVTWGGGRRGGGLLFNGRGQVRIAGAAVAKTTPPDPVLDQTVVAAMVVGETEGLSWVADGEHVRLRMAPRGKARRFRLLQWRGKRRHLDRFREIRFVANDVPNLADVVRSDPEARRPETMETEVRRVHETGPFAVDELSMPTDNPWNSWLRLGGFDFFDDGDRAAVCSWQGDVWTVSGLSGLDEGPAKLTWRCIATGLFQPLGLKIRDGAIYVLGRDQITRLVDADGDGETDFYENFNNDAQVTEHFHEFAMDLQTDAEGNFYYMKGARHAKTAVVPQHGTLLKVSADGQRTEILAGGFRAPNGLSVNPDGSFFTSDQEGHWTPMNRINRLVRGGFYGNMMAWAKDRKDTSHDQPLCWIHKNTDRSPAAQLWVRSQAWGALDGALLSLSYGTGRIWNVLHEEVDGVTQGGIVRLPLPEFPTGIQRGRFHPGDQQLYVCGLFGWSSNKTRPGGFFRIRRTDAPLSTPTSLNVVSTGVAIGFNEALDPATARDPRRYKVERWNYKRTARYGSRDWRISDGKQGRDRVTVSSVRLSADGRAVLLQIPDMVPCMQMEITCSLKTAVGEDAKAKLHHTIHRLGDPETLAAFRFEAGADPTSAVATGPARDLGQGLEARFFAGDRPTVPVDRRRTRLAALRVLEGESPTPFLAPGSFVAEWNGTLEVDVTARYRFHADVVGDVKVSVNGATVLTGRGRGAAPTRVNGKTLELLSGPATVRIQLESDEEGQAMLRALWSGSDFDPEPLPPQALRHARTPELLASERRDHGRTLFAERGCVRCHEPRGLAADRFRMPELEARAPSLAYAGGRLSPAWMAAWMLDPRGLQPKARMPHLLPKNDPEARGKAADIASWLAQFGRPPSVRDVVGASVPQGRKLYEELGCVACHTFEDPEVSDRYERHTLYHVGRKYLPGALRKYLEAPLRHHESSRMPDFGLSELEAASLALYLRDSAKAAPIRRPRRVAATDGRKAFLELGCANCHEVPGVEDARPRTDLAFGGSSAAGCVATRPDAFAPNFRLDDGELAALRSFLGTDGRSLEWHAPAAAAERAVEELRCAACHDRDGVPSHRVDVLLEEGHPDRIPEALPDLTWAGGKLRQTWLEKLFGGEPRVRSRPWLAARMPLFPARARTLARGMVAQHGTPEFDVGRPAPDAALAEQGELLTGTEGGFSCTQCHGVGDRKAFGPFGDRGVNFTLIGDRLRYDFYHRWMRAPQRVDPRTKMPTFTSDGRTTAVHDALGGDARRQFDALWHYIATAPRSSRRLVRNWTVAELAPVLERLGSGRSFAAGEKLFESMSCKQCHQVKGEGGVIGPDLTGIAEKHPPLAMLRELIEPSAVIDDEYRHHVLFTKDDDMISGLLVAEDAESLSIVEDALDPKAITKVLRADIDERRRANVSSMPTGLLDTLEQEEILDLMAYLRSGGNPAHPAFSQGK